MDNYFNYFTEIEEHFQKRRGSILLLSTLDWALIEVWKDAGIPLEAVLRGIDEAFDRYDQRPSKTRKVNSLAYCAQAVLSAAEQMKEAAVGTAPGESQKPRHGFANNEIAAFLRKNATELQGARLPERTGISGAAVAWEISKGLNALATEIESVTAAVRLEDLERRLNVMEEKLFAVLVAATDDGEIVEVRTQSERDIAPYRSKMPAIQIEQLQKQYLSKRLLEKYRLPRLSLFYM